MRLANAERERGNNLFPFKIRAIIIGLFKSREKTTVGRSRARLLDFTWALFHPLRSYTNETDFFIDCWDANDYGTWEFIGYCPGCILLGFFELLKRKLKVGLS